MTPRYPDIRVAVHSANPLTAISAIRGALRRAGVERREIATFSQQAFTSQDLDHLRDVCRHWVRVEAPTWHDAEDDPGAGVWPPNLPPARA